MEFQNKKIVVVGLGKSGMAARNLLVRHGARVTLYDGNQNMDVSGLKERVYLGNFDKAEFAEMDLAVFSPGVPLTIPLAHFFKEHHIPVIGEVELAYLFDRGMVVGITGTNGKTTTTTLVGEIARAYFKNVFVVGNIGTPYTEAAENSSEDSVTVAEISSFQLETIDKFKPHISVILNITPDHLDRHGNMEEYRKAKLAILKNQSKNNVCICNYEDVFLRSLEAKSYGNESEINTRMRYFSSKRKLSSGIYLDSGGNMVIAETNQAVCNVSECRLLGIHNYEDYMAAILIGMELKIPLSVIRDAVIAFKGVEHRIEFVRDWCGINFYNDSKATNTDAAIKGLQAMNRKTILIGGGFDKEADFTDWILSFQGRIKSLILLGETKFKIYDTAKKCGFHEVTIVASLKDAVRKASESARAGEAVLLSPACASWDMFASYEQRGNKFKQYVNDLE